MDLAPLAACLLVRIDAHPTADAETLGRSRGANTVQVRSALADLRERGLIAEASNDRRQRNHQWHDPATAGVVGAGCASVEHQLPRR